MSTVILALGTSVDNSAAVTSKIDLKWSGANSDKIAKMLKAVLDKVELPLNIKRVLLNKLTSTAVFEFKENIDLGCTNAAKKIELNIAGTVVRVKLKYSKD